MEQFQNQCLTGSGFVTGEDLPVCKGYLMSKNPRPVRVKNREGFAAKSLKLV